MSKDQDWHQSEAEGFEYWQYHLEGEYDEATSREWCEEDYGYVGEE